MLRRHFLPRQARNSLESSSVAAVPPGPVEMLPSKQKQEEEAQQMEQLCRELPGSPASGEVSTAPTEESYSEWASRIAGHMKNTRPVARLLKAPEQAGAGTPHSNRVAPPGDILGYTMPERRRKPRRRRGMAKSASAGGLPMSPSSTSSEPAPYVDPFTEWKQSTVDKEKMSLTELRVQTFEGQKQVKVQLKHNSSTFKSVDMAALEQLDEHRLFDNRTRYSGYGVLTSQRQATWKERKDRELNPPSEKELRRRKEEKELFDWYGLQFSKGRSTPSLKDVRKLMHECHERSPIVKEQRRVEGEERRRAEEQARGEAVAERQRIQREKLGGLKLGGAGQALLQFG